MTLPAQDTFRETVDAALAELKFQGGGMDLWSYEPWRALLLANDWVRPKWSDPAWSAQKKHDWYSACHSTFENFREPPELADVGPTLVRWGNEAADEAIAQIVDLSSQWAFCLFEPYAEDKVVFDGKGLSGQKYQVRDFNRAQHLLVVAEDVLGSGYLLLHCLKDAPGIAATMDAGLSGEASTCQVQFNDTPAIQILGHLPDVESLQELHFQTVAIFLGRSGALARQLELAANEIDRQDLDELRTRHAELSVEMLALQATESRACVQESQSKTLRIPWSALQAKGTALELKIGELLVDTFGYYALPYPDEITLHNEGAIGHAASLKATRQMLLATEAINYAGLAGDLYDIAAVDMGIAS